MSLPCTVTLGFINYCYKVNAIDQWVDLPMGKNHDYCNGEFAHTATILHCGALRSLSTTENKTLRIDNFPIFKDPMMTKIIHYSDVSFFVEIRTFQFAAVSLLALFVVS